MKECKECGIDKSYDQFHKNKTYTSGIINTCKACIKIYRDKYASEHKEEIRIANKKYAAAHKEERKIYSRKYIKENKAKIAAYKKQYYKDNSKKVAASVKRYRESATGKAKVKIIQKRYYTSDKGKAATLKNKLKYLNAYRSRSYFYKHNKNPRPTACSECKKESTRIEHHHFDYNKPMEVVALCKSCHVKAHKNFTPLNRVSGIFTDIKNLNEGYKDE